MRYAFLPDATKHSQMVSAAAKGDDGEPPIWSLARYAQVGSHDVRSLDQAVNRAR